MDTNKEKNPNLPLKGSIQPLYISSFVIALLMLFVSLAGLIYRMEIYPTDELLLAFIANDVVNLFIGLPILLGSIWLTVRGKLIGPLCWSGALFFVLYNYLTYLFAMPLSWVYLSYLVLTMLSLYTLTALLANIDGSVIRDRLSGAVPEKFAGGVLMGLGLLIFFRVIAVIGSSIINSIQLSETEMAVNISDFMVSPTWIIGGSLLWRRHAFGYVAGFGLLFQASMLFIGLIIFLLLQPILTSAPFIVTDLIVVLMMGLICFYPFALFVRGVVMSHMQ